MKEEAVTESTPDEEPFLARWSKRKQAAANPPVEQTPIEAVSPVTSPAPTDADMPPLDSLDENSDYEGFLSPEVSDALRQQALSKLFRSACFNVCDGLDDYAEDFTQFEKLGDVMTAELRHRLKREAERLAEKADAKAEAEAFDEESPSVAQGAHAAPAQSVEAHTELTPEQTPVNGPGASRKSEEVS
jgi:hypothetical protein